MKGGFGMAKVRIVVFGAVLFLFALGFTAYAAQGVINVNTATQEQLMMMPGIGEKISKNVVAYRQANGPFKSLDDLIKVKGISKKKLDKLRQNFVLEGQTTYIPVVSQKAPGKGTQKSKP
jgi:competence protein ComEA